MKEDSKAFIRKTIDEHAYIGIHKPVGETFTISYGHKDREQIGCFILPLEDMTEFMDYIYKKYNYTGEIYGRDPEDLTSTDIN